MKAASFLTVSVIFGSVLTNVRGNPEKEYPRHKRDDNLDLLCAIMNWGPRWCRTPQTVTSCPDFTFPKQVCCKEKDNGCCLDGQLHDLPVCTGAEWYAADPCDCTKYYRCSSDVALFSCPARGAWDNNEMACRGVAVEGPVFCGTRPFTLTYLPFLYATYTVSVRNGVFTPYRVITSFEASAPRDVVFNVLSYIAATNNLLSFTTSYDSKSWYTIICINNVCADNDRDSTVWLCTIDGSTQNGDGSGNIDMNLVIAESGSVIGFDLMRR